MPSSPPDSALQNTICARCGTMIGEERGSSSCPACMAADLAGGEWSDLLAPEGTEMLASGGFVVIEEIGRGGMGVVYRARQHAPGREVALKLLSPSFSATSDGAQRLVAEAAMLAELDHPGILPLYASGVQDGRPWLAMKLVSGGTLAARKPEWRGRWRECAELAAGLADAVQHAHERGLIHRDLKPGNILFDETGRAYVADFGLAKWRNTDSGLTHTNMVLGTPSYMAPEVALADVRAATTSSDVYGLGAILYFLLCGQPPFPQTGALDVIRRIVDEEPPPPRSIVPDVPRDLEVICLKAISRLPSARYSGPDALAADLRRWLAGESIEARPATRSEKFVRWVRRHPLSAGLAAALIVTVAVSGIMLLRERRALHAALTEAVKSRDAAYDSLGYAMRELPPQLEAVGRLSDLDGWFAHLQTQLGKLDEISRSPDSTDLSHRAGLNVHYARVLGWKGKLDESRKRLEDAVSLAKEAVRLAESEERSIESKEPHRPWTVLSAAHRQLAEYWIDEENFEKGHPFLDEARAAVAAGLKRFPGNLNLRLEEAEIANQVADSHLREENWSALNAAAMDAQKTWTALRRDLPSDAFPYLLQRTREKGPLPLFYLGCAAAETDGENERAIECFRALLAERKSQLNEKPSRELQREVAAAMGWLANRLRERDPAPIGEIATLLDEGEKMLSTLVNFDPDNEIFAADWAAAALHMAKLRKDQEDETGQIEWLKECLRRLENFKNSRRDALQEHRYQALKELTPLKGNVTAASWDEYLEAARQRASVVPARWTYHCSYMDRLKDSWSCFAEVEDARMLETRIRRWIAEAREAAEAPGGSPYWRAVEAGANRRLAGLLADIPERREEARAANRTALDLRARLFLHGKKQARDLNDDIVSTSEALLKIDPVPPTDARLILKTMTDLAPAALASGKTSDWRKGWMEVANNAILLLPGDEQTLAAKALERALYPPDVPAVATTDTPPLPKEMEGKFPQ